MPKRTPPVHMHALLIVLLLAGCRHRITPIVGGTTVPDADGNQGHAFGTKQLTDKQKRELLEYLETL